MERNEKEIEVKEEVIDQDENLTGNDNVEMKIKTEEHKEDCVIKNSIVELLTNQISRELYNHNLYKTLATYFCSVGLFDLEKYYDLRAQEEYNHHQWIVDYLRSCNAEFAYPIVKEVEVELEQPTDAFDITVQAEIETTEFIKEIYCKADEECDVQTTKWLTQLINEQTEEEGLSLKTRAIAEQDCDWITKAAEILKFYNKE